MKPNNFKLVIAKTSELNNWETNPRGITTEDFERLKEQIIDLGIYKPLIVSETDNVVIGGNMRLRAYRELGIENVPVTYIHAPTETEKLKYALSDNDRAGYYEEDKLAELLVKYPDIKLEMYKVDLGQLTPLDDLIKKYGPEEGENQELNVGDIDDGLIQCPKCKFRFPLPVET